ncbi:FAD-binding oxidoreductase [Pseudomonas aeruginosa]
MDDSELYRSLCEILGARGVRDRAALAGQDPGYHPQNLAGSFLVLPESTDQVAAVVRLCRQAGRALVPQGGLTGLVGGGAAQAGDVLLSLRRLNRIHRLDAASQTLDLDAGAPSNRPRRRRRGRTRPRHRSRRARSASVGGLVATNAGGIRAFRFGTMRQRVLGLEAVLADGSVYSDLRGLLKNTTGYDLKQLFVGAEGTLGIVTRAVLRLEPLQRPGATALLGLPDVDAAITIAARLRREHAERLFACEILWHDYLQCTAAPMGDSAPSLAPCPLYLLVELAEDRHLVAGEALTALLEGCFEEGLVEDALLAANETQRLAIWRLREDSDAAIHAGVDSLSFDVSLPVPALAGYVERIRRRLDDLVKGMRVFLFGHFLDGNLHVMLAADVPLLPLHQAVEEILYGELGECAGVISAEHGIGLEKKEALGRYADPLKLALMAQIKELLDPSGLFNPGKVIP